LVVCPPLPPFAPRPLRTSLRASPPGRTSIFFCPAHVSFTTPFSMDPRGDRILAVPSGLVPSTVPPFHCLDAARRPFFLFWPSGFCGRLFFLFFTPQYPRSCQVFAPTETNPPAIPPPQFCPVPQPLFLVEAHCARG